MRKLLLITNGFPYGESERSFLLTEFNELRKEFQIHILTLYDAEHVLKYPIAEDVQFGQYHIKKKWKRIFRLPRQLLRQEVREDLVQALQNGGIRKRFCKLIAILGNSESGEEIEPQLEEVVKAEKIDLIYTYWCTSATTAALRLKKRYSGLKVVTRFHGYDLFEDRTTRGWQCLRSYIAENCDKLIFVSQQGQRYFLDRWGKQWQEKSLVSYLGCRKMSLLKEGNNDCLKIVSCSNLIPLKRVGLIIAALAELPESLQVEWHHLGDGISRKSCEATAKEVLDSRKNIRYKFWGAVPNEKLEDVYKEIRPDIFLTASASEGLPVSVMEASAMGIPAIGSDVGGIAEIIEDGKTGFLLYSDPTSQEIADAIVKYNNLSNNDKLIMRKKAYKCWEKNFNAEENAKRFILKLGELAEE